MDPMRSVNGSSRHVREERRVKPGDQALAMITAARARPPDRLEATAKSDLI